MGNLVTIEAPMPGVVLRYEVKEGASVKEDDVVMVMEAMKMENEITSPASGVVKEIKFKAGDRIEEGDVLLTIE
jgi:pyruvate carboxylase subunit B